MTNAPFPASGGAPPTSSSSSYHSGPSISSVPRRSSYASIVSGSAAANETTPQHFGALAHYMNSNGVHRSRHSTSTSTSTSTTAATTAPGPFSPSTASPYPPQLVSGNPGLRHTTSLPGPDADMQVSYGATSAGWRRSGGLPPYSRQFANIPEYAAGYQAAGGGIATTSSPASSSFSDPSFFIPSYLRNSRYIARLESAQRAKQLAAQRESSSNPPSLSASSSHVNLHRMAPSHRGMTYDLIEKDLPSPEEDKPQPLPSRWNDADKHSGLDLLNDGLDVRYLGHQHKVDHEAASVRADYPMPREGGIYYYETTILAKPKDAVIAVGFSSSRSSLERLPGWDSESWAYHGDDGKAFIGESQGQGRPFGPTFSINDTIGCGVNFTTGCAFFTKNGILIGIAFRELHTSRNLGLYPAIGVKRHPNMHIRANFGQQPFMFDIDGLVRKEKACLLSEISATSTASLQPPLDEATLLQELVAQFLTQDGYYETARAFAEEVRKESAGLENSKSRHLYQYEPEEDLDAANRQKIRAAILEGDVDKALKHTNAYFSKVLQDNPHILFKLRCRKFLEMMCKCSDLSSAAMKQGKASNGVAHNDNEVYEQDMDLDDHMQDGYLDGDGMDTEEADSTIKFHELLTEAVQYGQQLRMDYPTDDRGGDKQYLDDIFSLVAYSDPKSSVHGHYLDASGRVAVADELNSAILVSLGKSSSAALETLYSQTEVLVSELSEDGGAGAFINIRGDFLS